MYERPGEPSLYEFANAAAEQAGIEVVLPVEDRYPRVISVMTPDELGWVRISEANSSAQSGKLDEFTCREEGFALRGLLADWSGNFEVSVQSPTCDLVYRKFMHISLLNSYQAVSRAQIALGQTPGKDAFQLKPYKSGLVSPGDLVEGVAADLTLRTSTQEYADMAQHDLEPDGHVFSWICMPESVALKIQAKAQELEGIHGDAIYEPEKIRPAAVSGFARGVDDWSNLVQPIFKAVRVLEIDDREEARGWGKRTIRSPLTELHQKIHHNRKIRGKVVASDFLSSRKTLYQLGLLEKGLERSEEYKVGVAVNKAVAVQTAKVFLKLDKVRPLENERPAAAVTRKHLLEEIVERYAA